MHFEQTSIKLFIPGDKEGQAMPTPGIPRNLNRYNMLKWLEGSSIDDDTKRELLTILAGYPANTVQHFYQNIHKHIQRLHAQRDKKEKENES